MTQHMDEHLDALGQQLDQHKTCIDSLNEKSTLAEELAHKVTAMEKKMDAYRLDHQRPTTDTRAPSWGEHKGFRSYVRQGDETWITKNMNASSPESGGVLVPQEVSEHVFSKLSETSFFRKIAKVTKISSEALDTLVAHNDLDVGWAKETDNREATTTPTFKKIHVPAHELYARIHATQRLIDDASIDIESWITQQVSQHIAQQETKAFIHGDGNGKPKGFLADAGAADGVQVIKTGKKGGFSDTNAIHTLFDIKSSLKSAYLSEAVWIMSRAAEAAVRKMKDPQNMQHLWQPAMKEGGQSSLLGYPVYITDHMPDLANDKASLSVAFGNFKEAYHIVDRQDMYILRDPYSHKPFVEFYVTKRVGGDVINPEAISVLNFDN